MATQSSGLDETKYTLFEHLGELRSRILKALIGILVTTLGCGIFASTILEYSTKPLREVLDDRNRLEAILVDDRVSDRTEELEDRLRGHPRARFRGRVASLSEVEGVVRGAAGSRRPIDLVLVSTSALGKNGLLVGDLVKDLRPSPHVVYLVGNPRDPIVAELQLEGAQVVLDPPRPAAFERLLRQAAATAGKATNTNKIVILSPLEYFFAYIKIALVCGLFLACPIWIFQAWSFVAPGLYRHERRFVLPVVLSGSILFVTGGLFAYYAMFPLMFDVLVNQMMPDTLAASFTLDKYLGLLLRLTVAFGVVFELPLALGLLSVLGIVDAARLRRFRKYAFVAAFVIGALLTPADPLSQAMMAVPLVVFYEVGILLASFLARTATDTTTTALVSDGESSGDDGQGM